MDDTFWLQIDPKATIIEAIWVQLARSFFLNPKEYNMVSLSESFPKLKDISNLRWIFWKVKTNKMHPNFNNLIDWKEFRVIVTSASGGWNRPLIVEVWVAVWLEIISEHSFTIA